MNDIVFKDKIITENKLINLVINELYTRNLTQYVFKIKIGNQFPIARFYIESKTICFNYNMMLSQIISNANKINFKSKIDFIKYINLNILSIVFHEITHVIQEKNKNGLLILSEKVEITLKEQKKYNSIYYLTNPIERQAQINSLSNVIKLCNNSNDSMPNLLLKHRLIDCISFGYNESNYPIKTFFQETNYFEKAIYYSKVEAKNFEKKLEYGCELSNQELNKIKELKL